VTDLPRSTRNLTLRLRELVVPVGLVAVRDKGEQVTFSHVHADCGEKIAYGRDCPDHGPVAADEVAKVWTNGGEQIAVDEDELEALAPADSDSIDVFAIVQADEIDPLLVTKAWYLSPGRGRAAKEAYAVLEHALDAEQLSALGRFTGWGREHVAAIDGDPDGRQVLLMRDLAPHAELRNATAISELIGDVTLSGRTCDLARKLLAKLEVPFEPGLLTNQHQQRVQDLLDAKQASGERIPKPQPKNPARAAHTTVDLDGALQHSLRGIPARKQRLADALAR
jgi:DNA end-binding protein Ku